MDIKLKEGYDSPYYIQLKNILKNKIQSGVIKTKQLPTVRQVARDLGISVNTVLRAYNELGKEGIVTGSVGKGTFVTVSPQEIKSRNRQTLLKKIVEHSLEEALSLEFSIEEFKNAVSEYVKEKLEMMGKVKLVFIECNIEQLAYFTDHLELDPHIRRIPVLLEDLRNQDREVMQKVSKSDIFVTSFYHLNEVQEQLEHLNKPVIGINIEPEVATLIKIAKIPSNSVVGIVTTSKKFRKEIKEVLERLDLRFSEIFETNSENRDTIQHLVKKCSAVLVSPKQKKIVLGFANSSTEVIEFIFSPDRTSINNLKVTIFELKKSLI